MFCYLASVGHWHDVGGNVPGNYNPEATESFQEGMLIPPVKLYDQGTYQQDIVDILSANSRLPFSLYGDLNGQINALDLGTERMTALLDEHSDEVVAQTFVILRDRAATLMRAEIAKLPSGTVSAEDFLDNDGVDDKPLKIALDLTITGDQMVLDFTRSAPACQGPVNISRATTVAACYVALKHIFVDVPANGGVLEPVEFRIDPNSILSVEAPKPVSGYTETILRLIDVAFQAIAQIAPTGAMACSYGTINALSIAGHRPSGQRWVMFSFFGGGHGACGGGDGLSHGNAPISTATIPPLEVLEAAYPVRFTKWALRPDSGGAGCWRGGLGGVYEIELLDKSAEVFLFGERGRFAPKGIVGGGSGALNRFSYQKGTTMQIPPMASKMVSINIEHGERLRLESPGGGGYGNAYERAPEAVMLDIRRGFVTTKSAKEIYGVALRKDGSIDEAVTAKLRSVSPKS